MFVDECVIEVVAGQGGDGCVSFRHEKYVPRGGPDGGDGGAGGDVRLTVSPHLRTLNHLQHTPSFRAAAGRPGKGKQMSGARGEDAVVVVPPGTVIVDVQSGELLCDAVAADAVRILARGGRGGRGNVHFKSAVRRTPREAEPGAPGEQRRLRLTLKLLADVGLVGLPNAGKSTLLARLSRARPKVADYPFTTLTPVLGIVPVGDWTTLVMADLPGLIAGAHSGKGLGQRFLRHIERTRLLLILIEAVDPDPEGTLGVLRGELEHWSPSLARRDFLVAYTKGDLLTEDARARLPKRGADEPLIISAHTGAGIAQLLALLGQKVLATGGEFEEPAEGEMPRARVAPDEGREPGPAERPWPTRWVVPSRPGARSLEALQREWDPGAEERGGRQDR